MQLRPRFAPDLAFPAIAYVPGQTAHPGRDHAEHPSRPPPGGPMTGKALNLALREGLDLFNHGYFWEAHEAWEAPWQVERRESPLRLYLQGLIRLAAAALKHRVEQPAGVIAHAGWCADVFSRLDRQHPDLTDTNGGPGMRALGDLAERLARGTEPWDTAWTGPNPCLTTILTMQISTQTI